MRQRVIFLVPKGHSLEAILGTQAGQDFIADARDKLDARWPRNWWMPGWSRIVQDKRLLLWNIRGGVTMEQIQNALDRNGINWTVLSGFREATEILKRLNGIPVLDLEQNPKRVRRIWARIQDKTAFLKFKDDVLSATLNADGSTTITATRPTTLGKLPHWLIAAAPVDLDGELDAEQEVEVADDTPDDGTVPEPEVLEAVR
ncbi:MAG: hypothetical protein R3179_08595 [Sedimenticolaceae bacterium]|nr:hypothetical protein [Sedimenticolaceae bacterium]